ncbi:MAG: PqqD family protein [Planctomycetota bacterium]
MVSPETLIRAVDGESVILNLKNESYYGLDDVGTAFWACLSTSPSIAAACDRLAEEFEAPPETIRKDMREFVEALAQRGLIDVTSE